MAKFPVAVTVFAILASLSSGSGTGYWSFRCLGGNFSANSVYQANLKIASARLQKASSSLFAIASVGNVERVHSLASCQRDTNASLCKQCIAEGFKEARRLCDFRKGAVIFRDFCTIGYHSTDLLSKLAPTDITAMKSDSSPVAIRSSLFEESVDELGKEVLDKAVVSNKHFGTGQKDVDADDYKLTVFLLAQCLPFMSTDACGSCLADLMLTLGSAEFTAGRAATLWCTYRYAPYHFFKSEPSLRLPAGKNTPPAAHHRKIHTIVWVIVGVGATLVVGIIVLLHIWWWRKREASRQNPTHTEKEKKNVQLTGTSHTEGVHVLAVQQVVCPSALESFTEITDLARGKIVALFLDYDGTLAPIVNNPAKAFMPEEMRDVVREAARLFPTSIVSGRKREEVVDLVGLEELSYCGSHGLDIKLAATASNNEINAETSPFQPAAGYAPLIDRVAAALAEATWHIEGSSVDHNKFCATVHYRNVAQQDHLQVRNKVNDVLNNNVDFTELNLKEGIMHFDIRPPINWNKGDAVKHILQNLVPDASSAFSIHIGDDTTDEDAFKVLRDEKLGMGLVVTEVQKETSAFYSLKGPQEVMLFLKKMVSWGMQNRMEEE